MASGPVTTAPRRDVHGVVAGYCKYLSLQFSIVIMVLVFAWSFHGYYVADNVLTM